jgi:hypothetical protein
MTLAHRASSAPRGATGTWLAFALLVAGTLWVALDGRHYWHDARFAFGCAEFSLPQLLAGVFNPHQAWGPIDEISSAGFYHAKALHLALLCSLVQRLPRNVESFQAIVAGSAAWVGIAVGSGYWAFRRLFAESRRARLAAAAFLLTPAIPYLAGKLLSEVTSLLPATLAVGMLAIALRSPRHPAAGWAAVGGLLLALAALARLDSVVGPAAFLTAAGLTAWADRRRLAQVLLIGAATCGVTYLSVAWGAGLRFINLWSYLQAFVGGEAKSLATSLLAIATTGGLVFPLAIIGLANRDRVTVRLLAVWTLLVWAAMVGLTATYSVEPRYLSAGLLPLAGLGALGIEVLIDRWPRLAVAPVASAAVLAAVGVNAVAVALMPYELDRPALLRAVATIERAGPGTRILIPWAYTDFNFLRSVLPDAEIFCVHSPEPEAPPERVVTWQARFRGWYGDRYLVEPERLQAFLASGPVYYLGWRRYPPLTNARAMVEALGLSGLAARLDLMAQRSLQDHLTASWIWRASDAVLEPAGQSGQYLYFRVRPREAP